MKTSSAVLALIGATNATYSVTVSVDEQALGQTAQAASQSVDQFVNDNMGDLEPVAMTAGAIVQEYVTRGMATDGLRADGALTVVMAYRDALYPSSDDCDEEAFATCLVDTQALDLFSGPGPDLFALFDTQCADDNGCVAPCVAYEYSSDERDEMCDDLGEDYYDGVETIEEADRQVLDALTVSVQAAYEENAAHLEALTQAFGDLAITLFDDFGCDEQCFETCFNDAAVDMQGDMASEEAMMEQAGMCAETTCCTATDAISIEPSYVQSNTQCQYNKALQVRCFTSEL